MLTNRRQYNPVTKTGVNMKFWIFILFITYAIISSIAAHADELIITQAPAKYSSMQELIAVETWKDVSRVPRVTEFIDQDQRGEREFMQRVARLDRVRH